MIISIVAATLAAIAPVQPRSQSASASRANARVLWLAARDSEAELHLDAAIALLRRARAVDPSWLVPSLDYVRLMRTQGRRAALRREFAGTAPLSRCLLAVGDAPDAGGPSFAAVARLWSDPETAGCAALWLPGLLEAHSPAMPRDSLAIIRRMYEEAIRVAPELAASWTQYAAGLEHEGSDSAAAAILAEGWQACGHPVERIQIADAMSRRRLARGDTSGARLLAGAAQAAASRDGRPELRLIAQGVWQATHDAPDAAERDAGQLESIIGSRAPGMLLRVLLNNGGRLIDDGRPAAAMRLLDSASRIADSIGEPELRLVARLRLGRAEVKMGHPRDGLRDLETARALVAGTDERYYRAEIWHNLAHAYESLGEFTSAARAVDTFVAATSWMPRDPVHLMSWHDAGVIRWEAGWHAAADSAFAAMVRVVDSTGTNHYWAGEYFERVGRLRAALAQYELGAASDPGERSLDLAGASRAAEALGMRDSAEAFARAHDAAIPQPTDVPLTPDLLVQHGHADAGIRLARAWADARDHAGNLQGAALARLQVAQLELDAGRLADARADASRAIVLANRVHLVAEATTGYRLEGEALRRSGGLQAALGVLRRAVVLADRQPASDEVLRAHVALGDALAAARRSHDALLEYDRAANVVDAVMGRLELDVERARYHGVHDDPFDRALTLLLRPPGPVNTDALVHWLERRQSASLIHALDSHDSTAPASIATLRARLDARDALVDYVFLDSVQGALVITHRRAAWIRFSAAPGTLASEIRLLREPLTTTAGGAVDLAHAPYDLERAHALYDAIVRPLLPALAGTKRWLIVPDGPLHYVSFAALVRALPPRASRNPYRDATYLLDDAEPWYLPTAAAMPDMHAAARWSAAALLIIREDVPGAEAEARGIETAWAPGRVRQLAGEQANEHAVLGAAEHAGVVHFITHARAKADDPLASYLELSPDASSDGMLHVAELEQGALRGHLVVLSACETIGGPLLEGEGIMGLARGVLAGGARSVVATQWPVGGASAGLMRVFYDSLRAGASAPAALRAAQLALRTSDTTAHPFYWGAWELVTRARATAPGQPSAPHPSAAPPRRRD